MNFIRDIPMASYYEAETFPLRIMASTEDSGSSGSGSIPLGGNLC